MIDYQPLYDSLNQRQASFWVESLQRRLSSAFDSDKHGDIARWRQALSELPQLKPDNRQMDQATACIGSKAQLTAEQRESLKQKLMEFHPWRKGPYDLYGIKIDTEWRSDLKWERIKDKISSLKNRLVLDVGCGNGYHCWRMFGEGADMVLGIDPTLLSVMQFQVIRHFHGPAPVYVLPLGIEDVPKELKIFDSVFSMGVLYHRRSPLDHLIELRDCLRPGGELVLETLVIDGPLGQVLLPEGRYAKMRNVWFIPSCDTLMAWMKRVGLVNISLLDVSKTGFDEQRSTDWMRFHSLKDFLDPDNPELTLEGHPAPMRAVFKAQVN